MGAAFKSVRKDYPIGVVTGRGKCFSDGSVMRRLVTMRNRVISARLASRGFAFVVGLSAVLCGGRGDAQEIAVLEGKKAVGVRTVSLAFSPDGKTLAAADIAAIVQLWDVDKNEVRATIGSQELLDLGFLSYVAFSKSGKTLAVAGRTGALLLDPATRKVKFALAGHRQVAGPGHSGQVNSVSFSDDGKMLASCSTDNKIFVWNPVNGKALRILEWHSVGSAVTSVAFSPNGKILASGSRDKDVILWNPTNGKVLKTLKGGETDVVALAFSNDGLTLASGRADGSVDLWDIETAKVRTKLPAHGKSCRLAISPKANVLATGGADKLVKLWNVGTGKELATLAGHTGPVLAVAFTADGRTLASCAEDNTIRLWDVTKALAKADK